MSTTEPLRVPAVVGTKLMGNRQEAPAASDPAVEELALTSGHAVAPLLARVKFAAMFGLFPVEGMGKFSIALPIFLTVTVRGLSLLAEPTCVEAKVRDGGSAKSNSFTALLPESATKTFPFPSTATPWGPLKPLPRVLTVA